MTAHALTLLWEHPEPPMALPTGIYLRGRVYWIRYTVRGQQVRESSHSTHRKAAEDLLKLRVGELALGQYLGPRAERVTVDELCAAVLRDYATRELRGIATAKQAVARILTHFAGWRAVDVTTESVDAFIAALRAKGAAVATIDVTLNYLRRAFRLGLRDRKVALAPYIPTLTALATVREGFFEAPVFETIVAHLEPVLADACRFGFLTGWRRREVFDLPWRDVDLVEGTVRLPATRSKNRRGRKIGMDSRLGLEGLRAILERRAADRRVDVPYVFHRNGRPLTRIDRQWQDACTHAGVHGMVFHDLRRTAVRNLIRAGVPKTVAKAITGHVTDRVFDRYDIVDTRDTTLALDSVLDYLDLERQRKPAVAVLRPERKERGS